MLFQIFHELLRANSIHAVLWTVSEKDVIVC